jgi:adenine phosphoribosyltransferase
MLRESLQKTIRDVHDFPKPGIVFKDITPILENPALCESITIAFAEEFKNVHLDAVAGIESRGFLFGFLLAQRLKKPFLLIRKAGKLPGKVIAMEYALEYGTATIEMQEGAVQKGWKVLMHDDLLATGGTANAAAELICKQQAHVVAFSFVAELDFLKGRERLLNYSKQITSLIHY